jgi:energy-coupling factor transporter ATP-binding protein EcfA2
MAGAFSRGSEWLRWDPHVHAPGTVLEDRFGGDWDGYFAAIEAAKPAVVALGVTDYMGIGCYEEFCRRRGTRAAGVLLVFPNIEFRLSPFTSDNKALNAHLLVSPDDPCHVEEIRNALSNLQFDADGGPYRCDADGLMRLGRRRDSGLDGRAAFRRGVEQFTPSFETFKRWWESEAWLRKNSIVVFDGTGDDGVSGIRGARWASVREDVCRFSNAIFSSNERDRLFWLGGTDRDEIARLNGPKPCFHGSDAHSLERTCAPVGNRCTWIRATPTFEGLRQALYEPADRAWIGERPPEERPAHRVACEVRFADSRHWLTNGSVPLNPGLVAIIGPRGSGKTALADSIAAAAGAPEVGAASFVAKAADQLGDSAIALGWGDGSESSPVTLRDAPAEPAPAVRYLSQQFVERLCSEDELDGSESPHSGLLDEIESVVFSRLADTDATFASTFTELRDGRCEPIDEAIRALSNEMADLTREIASIHAARDRLPARREALKKLSDEIGALGRHAEKLVGPENPAVVREVQELQAKKTELQAKIAALRATDQDLDNLAAEYARREKELGAFHGGAKRRLLLAGASESVVSSLQPRFGADPAGVITALRARIQKDVDTIAGTGTPPAQGTAAHLQARIDELQNGIKADLARKTKLTEVTKSAGVKQSETAKLQHEISETERQVGRVPTLLSRRVDTYLEVFECVQRKKDALSDLYAPLRAHLDARGATDEREIDFYVRTRIRLAKWVADGEALLDRRKSPHSIDELARKHLVQAWSDGDRVRLATGIAVVYEAFRNVKDYLKTGVTPQEFGEWLFSTDHITLQYGLRFDGTDLDHLSPGAKGVALLLLYLSIDTNDERPLIIDQPEENLDPKSVYDVLVPHIKRARQRRQVIIVTHNPNLVVNTDADQVIVAASVRRERGKLPEISYTSGALEDPAIRDAVCEILEGGAQAFRQRERRYGLAAPPATR